MKREPVAPLLSISFPAGSRRRSIPARSPLAAAKAARRSPLKWPFGLIAAAAIAAIGPTPAQAAAIQWTGGTSFWDIVTNWSSSPLLPGAADDVVIDVAGIQTITHRSGTHTINSLSMSGDDILAVTGGNLTVGNGFTNAARTNISSGTLTLNGASGMASLALSGGALAGSGPVTVVGASSWLGGAQSGTGTTRFDGAVSISGVAAKSISGGRIVNLNGTTTWGGNTGNNNNSLQFAGGTLNNAGTFNDQNAFASFIDRGTGTNAFNNLGTYNKQSNTVTTVEAFYNNAGTTNVNAGTMLMQGSSATSGVFNLASGTTLEFRNGSHVLNNATIAGRGTFVVSTENVGADALVTLNGGTLTSAFLLSGSTLNGTDQVFQGPATWTGGTLNGSAAQSTTFGGTLTITGAVGKTLSGGRSINAGNTIWSSNTGNGNNAISLGGSGTFNNTGSFTDANAFNSTMGSGTFNNSGTFAKQSNTTTSIGTVFNNTGAVNVTAGTMLMNGGGISTGVFNIAASATLVYRNGSHTLNNVTTSGLGTLEISTENVGADATVAINGGTHTSAFVLSGSRLTGSDHSFQGPASWTGGTITGAATASTTFGGTLAISGPGSKTLSGGRSVVAGNTTWSGNTGNGNNAINISGASAFNNTGNFTDANPFDSAINGGNGGGSFNSNNFDKQSSTTTSIGARFNSTGTVNVRAGTMLMQGGGTSTGVFNIAGGALLEFRNGSHTLDNVTTRGAGVLQISTENVGADATVAINGGTHTTPFLLSGSTLTGTDHTFQGLVTWTGGGISGAATTTFANDVTISGPNLKTLVGGRTLNLNGTSTWSGNTAANNNAIRFWNGATINNNGTFNDANAFASFIEHNVGGPHNFRNFGTYNKLSSTLTTVDLGVVFNNAGTLNLDAGTMRFVSGTQGPTGTVKVESGATFQHDAASTVGTLSTAGNLVLANRTLTVFTDYDNTHFAVGNSFDRRANVSTTGAGNRLIAAGDADQGLTGVGVVNGNTVAPSIVVGNLHVGANTTTYSITNTGTSGPALRGAIQDAVNGGHISDARLSGTGVTSGSWGPVAPGAATSRDITITVANAGIYLPLAGQAVSIVNNFENTRSQLLTISSAAGAAAYNLAAAAVTPIPLTLPNQRVGGTVFGALTIANTAPAGAFTERLDASFGALTGGVLSNGGSVVGLVGGGSDGSSMQLRVDTSRAGNVAGTAAINLVSNGDGSSNLGITPLASQLVNVSGKVFQLAAGQLNTPALNFGTVQVGQSVGQVLSVSNVATGTAGFVEDLNVRFGASSGTGASLFSGSGSISNLRAGDTDASGLTVHVNTATAGTVNGAIAVNYFSAGAVNGSGNGLGELAVGSSSFGVVGAIQAVANVINQALPVINNSVIDLGNVRIGTPSPTQAVSITNQSTVAPQAALNASVSAATPISAVGSFNLLAPGGSNSDIRVGLQTGTAGAKSGTATVSFVSDANNVGNCAPSCQLDLAPQAVSVSGNVYRLASPTLNTPGVDLVARVGDANPTAPVSVTNTSPDAFTERLDASFGAVAAGFAGHGTLGGLAAGVSSSALALSMSTGAAGSFAGIARLNFVSSGSGTTGAPDADLGSQEVALSGRVYTSAVAQLNTPVVDFGIVHKGDVVAARNVSVTNAAEVAAPNDVLVGGLVAATGPFVASGQLAGLAAQASDASSLGVALDTAAAGIFIGSVGTEFRSHNAEMSDQTLAAASVKLKAQVNNFAELAVAKLGGDGVLSAFANGYTLDFGTIVLGSTGHAADLGIFNSAIGPADLLNGAFAFALAPGFSLAGFDAFADLEAGSHLGGFDIVLDSAAIGSFSQTVTISSFGTNASGYQGASFDTTLVLRGNVVGVEAVPEPETYALMAGGLLVIWASRRRASRRTARICRN